jgi:hypothetical protein
MTVGVAYGMLGKKKMRWSCIRKIETKTNEELIQWWTVTLLPFGIPLANLINFFIT